ncbi:MFS general substrate transporter [Dipodascopsis uninucleata]
MKWPTLRARDDRITSGATLTIRQSLLPICLVTMLFFLWGFAYGLLDVLNKHFQTSLNITRARSSGLQAAYFGAYPVASLTFAGWTLRKVGYRATFILGLTLYGIGALLFMPAAIKRSFGGFCGATFVIGSGLGTLESAANPYLAVCGPPRYSEVRLNIAQAFQGVGTVVGPILASYVFFKNTTENSLDSVKWVYVGIAGFVFLLALVFYFSNIPEITDADMEHQMVSTQGEANDKPIYKEYTLMLASISQFLYIGAQVSLATYFINYATEVRPGTSSSDGSNFLAIAQGCFSIGRFIGSAIMKYVKPRYALQAYLTCAIISISLAIGLKKNAGLALLMVTLFFESICFPTIFALGIRGLGANTKLGSSFIISAIIGGAIGPPITGAVSDKLNSTQHAFFIPLIFFVVAQIFPCACNFHAKTRKLMDDFSESTVGVTGADANSNDISDIKMEEDRVENINSNIEK